MAEQMNAEEKRRIHFRYNWSVYWGMLRRYQPLLYTLLALVLLIEASYVADHYLFKLVVDAATSLEAGDAARQGFVQTVLTIAAIFGAITLVRAVLKFIHIRMMTHIETSMIYDLKTKFFNHILGLSHRFHVTNKTGSLISRLVRGGSAIERMTDVLIFNISPLLFKLAAVAIALAYFLPITALITIVTLTLYIGYSLIIQRVQEPYNIRRNDVEDREKAHISDFLTNVDAIKYYGKKAHTCNRFAQMARASSDALARYWNFYSWMDLGQALILSAGLLALVATATLSFLEGEITVGSLAFIYTSFGSLIGPLFGFLHGVRAFYQAMGDFEVLFAYNRERNEVADAPDAKTARIRHGEIEFRNVTFGYQHKPLFHRLNLRIAPHTKVALVGHSGCGKTTLIKLLYRLYDVQEGQVLVDGTDVRRYTKESLRAQMAVVPQECALFDDSIFNNIAFSRPDATRKQVWQAIRFAQLDTIIARMPQKEQTIVGERGVRLSGGEKQRVNIARALLANKRILVLDEATSSLDSKTEHEIQRDLERLMAGRTSIIIAHRLSTIMKADEIIVLEHGRIVERGSHHQLVRRDGHYKRLWQMQKGGYIK